MATEQLEATRANDARVAEAMGWKLRTWSHHGYCWIGPDGHDVSECFDVREDPAEFHLKWTTDPAQVVPMMTRLGELQPGPIDLSPPGEGRAHSWRVNLWQRIRTFDGATANLAVAAALLSVWEARKETS